MDYWRQKREEPIESEIEIPTKEQIEGKTIIGVDEGRQYLWMATDRERKGKRNCDIPRVSKKRIMMWHELHNQISS
jgi:hypothetical protein